ncbi:MAG: right-handed parallel beta-helix repeat-containing protein, partial [Dehalococcoidia bacterium]|nr:right-handed parallel beta-helix repeat-containing protein [Dehalococcoidia bacterium]
MGLVTAVPVGAQISEVWVDDDFTEATAGWGTTHFATIQDGIDAVDPDGTVYVADGDYNATTLNSTQGGLEEGWWFVTISESLDLIGESRDGVILDGSQLYEEYRSAGIWVSASDVTIKNLTIQNFYVSDPDHYSYGLVSWEKFRNFNTGEVNVLPLSYVTAENLKVVDCQASLYFMMTEHATVKDCIVEGSKADGIWIAMGSSNATVEGNIVTNSADHGIWVGGAGWCPPVNCPNATIKGNNVNGAREGGISFVGSDGATISGNTITNVAGEGWSVGALSLKDGPSNVQAYSNTIYNNDGSWGGYSGTGHGVGIDGTPSNINLHHNNIYGDTGYGVYNYSTVVVMAENNWWGHASGPSGEYGRVNKAGKVIGKGDAV